MYESRELPLGPGGGEPEADGVRPLLLVEGAAEDGGVGEHARSDHPLREVVLRGGLLW